MRHNVKDFIAWCSETLPTPRIVLEIGSYRVEGQEDLANLRPLFPESTYIGCDLRKGAGVDVIADALNLPLPNACCDLVICADTIEHILHPWQAIREIKRVLHPNGFAIITSVMDFPIHDYPHDYWRFTQEIFAEFGRHIGNFKVFYQGNTLNPHTLILLASPSSTLPDTFPSYADGLPLIPYGREPDFSASLVQNPYTPRFASRKYLLEGDNPWSYTLKLVPEGSKVLDVGCGPGYVGGILKRLKNCTLYGIEINPFAAAIASQHYETVKMADVEKKPLDSICQGEKFDVILFLDIIEHLKDPEELLLSAKKILKDKGMIIVSVPNITYAGAVAEMIKGNFTYKPIGIQDETHLRHFSLSGIISLLEGTGFKIDRILRVVRRPEETEYRDAWDELPHNIRNFIEAHNPEFATYQFVIAASPCLRYAGKEIPSEEKWHQALVTEIARLDRELAEKEKFINDLLTSKSWRITYPLRKTMEYIRRYMKR